MTNHELRSARKERAFTQLEMAQALGVPVSTYRKWEQGERKVPGLVAGQLAKRTIAVKHLGVAESVDFARRVNALGIDPDQLVTDLIREWMASPASDIDPPVAET